ncbi:MAG TPA: hypothetical protein PKA58_01800 [Polyangium sp.]|nr:hypothetical protein [Polyangium sp.]
MARSVDAWQWGAVTEPGSADESELAWHERALRLLAVALPAGLALTRAAGGAQWRDDLPALRDLGLLAVGAAGGASTIITQTLSLLPLGPRTFRAALGSVFMLAVASLLLFGFVRRLLRIQGTSRSLASLLATLATLMATLSPSWQREATVGGGAMIAIGLALMTTMFGLQNIVTREREPGFAEAISFGGLLGATLAESPPAAAAALLAVMSGFFAERTVHISKRSKTPPWVPSSRFLGAGFVSATVVASLLLVPFFVRPFAPRAFADVGRALSTTDLTGFDVAGPRLTSLAAWIREVGLVSLGIAVVGAATSFQSPRSRKFIAPLLAFVLLDTLMPARAFGALYIDVLTPLRALAVLAIAASSALGVALVTRKLFDLRLPMAKSGAVLIVAFHVTLVALSSEEAGYVADRSKQMAAEEWTDSAIGNLEPSAAVLVRSPAMAFRLWAARVLRGERPDVLIVPERLLHRGRVAFSLLAAEPEVEPLLRDYAIAGEPTEYALSRLADVRPLHVEFDRSWSKRLVSHMTVDGCWLEYAPQPLGPSDRKMSTTASLAPIKRVMDAIAVPLVPDAATAGVLSGSLRDQSTVLSLLGEHDAAQTYLDEVGHLSSTDLGMLSPFIKHAFMAKAMVIMANMRSPHRPGTSASR